MHFWTLQRYNWITDEWKTVFEADDARAEENAYFAANAEFVSGNAYRLYRDEVLWLDGDPASGDA